MPTISLEEAFPGTSLQTTAQAQPTAPAAQSESNLGSRALSLQEAFPGQGKTDKESDDFLSRVQRDLEARGAEFFDIQQAAESGEQGVLQTATQIAGKNIAGPVLDIVGEGVVSGFRELMEVTPEAVKDTASEAGHAVLNTTVGKAGLAALEAGSDAYGEFKQENPNAARTLESVINIGLVFAPVKGGSATKSPKTLAGKAADKLAVPVTEQRKQQVVEMIRPKATAKVKEELAKRTTQNKIGTDIITPSTKELDVANEVMKLGVKPNKGSQFNLEVITNANLKEAIKLKKSLEGSKVIFPRKEINNFMDNVALDLANTPTLVGDAGKVAQGVVQKAKMVLAKHPSTPAGVLAARKELDKLIPQSVFGTSIETGRSEAMRATRRAMNDFMAAKVPGAAVKDSLRKQSLYYQATDGLASKAAGEASNKIARGWQALQKANPMTKGMNQQTATLLGAGTLGAGMTFAPVLTSTLLGSYAIYKGGAALSKNTKKGVMNILNGMDKAIRTTKDKNLVAELRQSRAALKELLEASEKLPRSQQESPIFKDTFDPNLSIEEAVKQDEERLKSNVEIVESRAKQESFKAKINPQAMQNATPEALQMLNERPELVEQFNETFTPQ